MEDGASGRVNLVPTIVTAIAVAFVEPVMLGYPLAPWAVNAIRPASLFNPL